MVNPDYVEGKEGQSENDRYIGYCVEVAQKLAEHIGYDYVIRVVGDGKYGSQEANGSWNGMIGELIRGVSRLPAISGSRE